jgi:hypothetical protein
MRAQEPAEITREAEDSVYGAEQMGEIEYRRHVV